MLMQESRRPLFDSGLGHLEIAMHFVSGHGMCRLGGRYDVSYFALRGLVLTLTMRVTWWFVEDGTAKTNINLESGRWLDPPETDACVFVHLSVRSVIKIEDQPSRK